MPLKILVLGAAYGMLPGVKLSLAGHIVTLVGRAAETAAMARGPLEVHIPSRRGGPGIVLSVEASAAAAPGQVALATPAGVTAASFDLAIFAMQEPQYREPAVAALMAEIAAAALPCLSIMNLAPPPFLTRLGIDAAMIGPGVHHSGAVWDRFDPRKITLASPDPQAVRPDPSAPGRLQVTLPSNFKAAPFALAEDQAMLQRLASDMSHLTVAVGETQVRPPVALIAGHSLHVPLAKWPMLLTGNCRCVTPEGIRTIADAVSADLEASAAIYADVTDLAVRLGARAQDLVGFDAYLKATALLTRPSSLARALDGGSVEVERIDRLVRNLMHWHAMPDDRIAPIAEEIDRRIARNRVTAGNTVA